MISIIMRAGVSYTVTECGFC